MPVNTSQRLSQLATGKTPTTAASSARDGSISRRALRGARRYNPMGARPIKVSPGAIAVTPLSYQSRSSAWYKKKAPRRIESLEDCLQRLVLKESAPAVSEETTFTTYEVASLPTDSFSDKHTCYSSTGIDINYPPWMSALQSPSLGTPTPTSVASSVATTSHGLPTWMAQPGPFDASYFVISSEDIARAPEAANFTVYPSNLFTDDNFAYYQ